jgi:hypothetical protein
LLQPEPEASAALALLRVAVAGIVITSPEVWSSMALDATTVALRTPPEGLGWFAALVPITPALVDLSRVLVVVTGVSGLVGFFARTAFASLSVASFYLFGCSELVGAARHNMHLFWFTVLLGVSPCASRWSIDAVRGRAREESGNATIALWVARALLASVYFFPGYWKLREAGFHWAFSDNLQNQIYWKWFQNAWMPSVRVDRHADLIRAGAAGVMLLELGFPLLVATRRGRMLAAAGGFGFHVLADAFMRLGFASLWWCYAPLIDMRRIVRWLYDSDANAPGVSRERLGKGALPLLVVGFVLVGANVVQGFRGAVQAWPFACYPTFQYPAGREMPDLVVTASLPDGTEQTLDGGTRGLTFRDPRDWGMVWKLLGAYGGPASPDGLRAFYERRRAAGHAASAPPDARALRFFRGDFSVVPEDRGRGPVRVLLVAEVPLSVPAG